MVSKLEQHIVSLLQDEDKRAIPLIYENYSDTLYGIILKVTNNEALAEDALQETFIKVWRYAKKYDASKAKLFTWLYRIARNTAIDKLRSHNLKFDKEIQISNSNVHRLPAMSLNQDTIGGLVKAGLSQYLALEIGRGANRDTRFFNKFLPWLNSPPTTVQQG